MAALTDISDIVNRCTGGNSGSPEHVFFWKDARVAGAAAAATVAGRITSLWQYDGSPGPGAAPTTWANPDETTNGGLKQTNPGGGRQKWLLGATAAPLAAGTLILYDRLGHIGNLSGTTTTAQTFTGTVTRYTDGVGNQIWAEIYTQIGATATTFTCSYTDQDGNSGQTTAATAIGGTGLREVQRIIPVPLASGDTGVRSVENADLVATTGTAGAWGITIAHPLLVLPVGVLGVGTIRDLIAGLPGIQEIVPGACLAWAWLANGTTAPQIFGSVHTIEA